MKNININYSALVLVVTAFAVSLTGCGQKQDLNPRTQPELVRIVEIGSSSGADPAFTGVVSARVQSNLGFPAIDDVPHGYRRIVDLSSNRLQGDQQ